MAVGAVQHVGAPAPGDPRVRARPVHRNGRTLIPLSQRPGGIRAYKLLVPAGESVGEQKSHEGYEWMYAVSAVSELASGTTSAGRPSRRTWCSAVGSGRRRGR